MEEAQALETCFRAGYAGNALQPQQLDVYYSQIGGPACLPPEAPDLECCVCHKYLRLLMQFVSGNSDPSVHRVVFVFMCDARHYKESLRVYVYYYAYQPIVAYEASEPPKTYQKAPDADELLDMLAYMGTQPVAVDPAPYPPKLQFQLQNATYQAFDAFSREAVDLSEQLALSGHNFADSVHQICKSIVYLSAPTHLCEYRCVLQLKKGHFLQKPWQEESDGVDDEIEEEIEEYSDEKAASGQDAAIYQADLHICDCEWCSEFLAQNAHEIDIFGAIIWKLYLKAAEFKAVYCYAPVYPESGWRQGLGIVLKDDDDVSYLVKMSRDQR